jgi:uncharacterized protein
MTESSTGVGGVDVVETHISTVFFTPDRAYKLLKPITTGFLDHADRDRRIWATEQEVALNRRLAPDVYLGLGDLIENGELVDRVVIMRRLPADRRLSSLVGDPGFDDHLRSIARLVATFHAGLPPVVAPVPLGTAEGLSVFWASSCDDIEPAVGRIIDRDEFDEVRDLAFGYLGHHAAVFERRREQGWIRDGHGDLIADDIFMLDDGPRILDCLAFDADYRTSDVLADIAFLVMDVERLAGRAAAERLMASYREFTNEHHPGSLAHHYVAYRAHVRAKVAVIQHAQGHRDAAELARRYHAQALEHLRRARTTLVLVGGGPGTGKTTLANVLADRLNWSTVDSDTIRKDLRRIDHDDHRVEDHPNLYSDDTTDATYDQMLRHARLTLAAGESVIIDATWTRARHRDAARRVASEVGAVCVELECRLDPDLAKSRIERRRLETSDASDATPEIVDLLATRDPWPTALVVDTRPSPAEAVDSVIAATLAVPVRSAAQGDHP